MTISETQTVDSLARVTLPKDFAQTNVVVEQVSETEIRIKKADASPGNTTEFPEEIVHVLSDRDRDRFLELLENPPPPNTALRNAMSKHRKQDG